MQLPVGPNDIHGYCVHFRNTYHGMLFYAKISYLYRSIRSFALMNKLVVTGVLGIIFLYRLSYNSLNNNYESSKEIINFILYYPLYPYYYMVFLKLLQGGRLGIRFCDSSFCIYYLPLLKSNSNSNKTEMEL